MTDQEIDKLREKLGSEYSVKREGNLVAVELADIWDGVEFAECVEYCKGSRTGKEIIKGQIYRIKDLFKRELVYVDGFEYGWPVIFFKPSTESAYVEQLKSKAHELYGEIKDGDWFDRSDMGFEDNHRIGKVLLSVHGWDYSKIDDKLYFGTICIYQQGKWAKKIERVRVVPSEIHYPKPHLDQYVTVELRVIGGILDASKSNRAAKELAKCLEDYLNKIP